MVVATKEAPIKWIQSKTFAHAPQDQSNASFIGTKGPAIAALPAKA